MRIVHPSQEVAHLWAHQTQATARNATSSVFFESDTIYSYGGHFPMARILNNAVLVTTRKYSVTTSKHQHYVWQACHHMENVFYVDNVRARTKSEHRENLSIMREEYESEVLKSSRARKYAQIHLDNAERLINSANIYAAFFKLTTRIKPADIEMIAARAKRTATAVRLARKKAAAKQEKAYQEAIESWRNGSRYSLPYSYGNKSALLRLSSDGEKVQTSQGASFPVSHAIRAIPLVMRCKNKSKEWIRNGENIRLGHYKLDKIDESGNVTAGCHRVKFAEVQHLAEMLETYETDSGEIAA